MVPKKDAGEGGRRGREKKNECSNCCKTRIKYMEQFDSQRSDEGVVWLRVGREIRVED